MTVPVLVLDVDEAEADKILLTHDPLAGMATISEEHLQSLLTDVDTESTAVRAMLENLTHSAPGSAGGSPPPIEPPEVTVPECYQVVVECHDEADQQNVFETRRAEGYRCRVLTL
jgi:hypothetical protein